MLNMIINIIINLILAIPFICLIACAVRESKICVKYNDMGLTRCRVCGALTALGVLGIYLFLAIVIEFLINSDKAAYFANFEHPKIFVAFCIAGIPLAIIPYKIALKRCPQELRKGFLFDLVSIGMGVLLKLGWALCLLFLYLFFKLLGIVTDLAFPFAETVVKAAGTATITAKTSNGKTATCTITVTETAVESITFDKTTAQMNVDETMTLTATIAPANAGNKNLTWFSNNESVLTVTASGQVKAVGAGKATITAKSANGKIAMCVITVVDPSSYKVEFTSKSVNMTVGSTMALEYAPLPDGIIPEFEVVDEDIVSIDKNGIVTGLKAGDAVIEARVGKGEWTWIYVFVQPTTDEEAAARQKFAEEVLYYVNIERTKA